MSVKARERAQDAGDPRPAARAPMGVRVLLAVLAVLALCAAGVAGVNLVAVMRYNEATAALNENLKTAGKSDVDLDALSAGQQQTDAQFDDAGALSFLLFPSVRQSISQNRQVSRKLTSRTVKEVAKLKGESTSDTAAAGSGTGAGASRNAKKGGGLTAKQKRQVEELLKANQQSTPSDSTTKNDDGTKKDTAKTQTTKPW